MQVAIALLVGLCVGIVVTSLSNAALYQPFDVTWPPNLAGFWGRLYGAFASVVALGIALMVLARRAPRSPSSARWGRLIAALALGVFGLIVVGWILMWRFTPWSPEGAWIYPLAVIPLLASGALIRSFRRE